MWIPETMMTSNYIKARDEIGTIDNGRLYVAVSSICEQPILGLFAGVQFKAGDVITSYGGLLKTAHEVRKSGTMKSHVRRIPGSIYVRDGYEWSQCFDRKSTEFKRSSMEFNRKSIEFNRKSMEFNRKSIEYNTKSIQTQ